MDRIDFTDEGTKQYAELSSILTSERGLVDFLLKEQKEIQATLLTASPSAWERESTKSYLESLERRYNELPMAIESSLREYNRLHAEMERLTSELMSSGYIRTVVDGEIVYVPDKQCDHDDKKWYEFWK